jgi:predicted NodU family carbamoyl transferase
VLLDTQPAGAVVVGISGAQRNAAAAVAVNGRLRAFCEEERLTRVRGVALQSGELPQEAVAAVLRSVERERDAVTMYVAGEDGVSIPAGLPFMRLDHHHAHAATAFLTSPFQRAVVLVCDSRTIPEVSVWLGAGDELANQHWIWNFQGFASLFSECCQLFGFPARSEYRLEALARLGRGDEVERTAKLFRYADGVLQIDPGWKVALSTWLHQHGKPWSLEHGALVASAVQRAMATP